MVENKDTEKSSINTKKSEAVTYEGFPWGLTIWLFVFGLLIALFSVSIYSTILNRSISNRPRIDSSESKAEMEDAKRRLSEKKRRLLEEKRKRQQAERRKLLKELKDIEEESSTKISAAFKIFQQELDLGNSYFIYAEERAPDIIAEITSLSGCKDICWLMVKDHFNETNTAEEFIKMSLVPITIKCEYGAKSINRSLIKLSDTLNRIQTDTNRKLCALSDKMVDKLEIDTADMETLQNELLDMGNRVRKIALSTANSITGISISLIAETVTRSTTRTLGKIVARFLAKTAAFSWLPVADGPLPIGDICWGMLETAFFAWDCYNLHEAQITLKNTLKRDLFESINKCKNSSYASAYKNSIKIIDNYNNLLREQAENIKEKIQN